MAIHNTTRLALRYPDLAEPADVPAYIEDLALDIDAKATGFSQGLFSARPAAGTEGLFYWATDTTVMYYDNGTTWNPLNSVADGSVTIAKLATSVPIIPVGALVDFPWSGASIPAWSSLSYGQAIAQSGHADLTALDVASGHPHGTSTGNIVMPDYRGRIGAGKDDMGGTAASRITVGVSGINGATLGAVGGAEGITLTTAQIPAHNHGITGAPSVSDPTHAHSATVRKDSGSTGIFNFSYNDPSTVSTLSVNASSTGISVGAGSLATSNAGSGSAHANVQPIIVVNKFMRVV